MGASFRATTLKATSDNGALVLGTKAPPLTDEDSVFVIKVDMNAEISWSRAFQFDVDIHEVKDVLELQDGSFIVYGVFESSVEFQSSIFLVKFDPEGNFIWSREISSQLDGAFLHCGGLIQNSDGGFWLSASTRFNSEGSWLALLNSNGNIQSVKFYDTHDLTDAQPRPFALTRQVNGSLDLFYSQSSFQDGSVLVKLTTSADGDVLQTSIFYQDDGDFGGFSYVHQGQEGEYYLSGYSFPNMENYSNGIAMKITDNSDITWAKEYGTSYIESLLGIVPLESDDLITIGFADPEMEIISPSENGLYSWLMKINSIGEANCNSNNLTLTTSEVNVSSTSYQLDEEAGVQSEPSDWISFSISPVSEEIICEPVSINESSTDFIKIFPNPVSDILNITLPNTWINTRLLITTSEGKKIYEDFISSGSQRLNLALPSGVYALQLLDSSGKLHSERIVKL